MKKIADIITKVMKNEIVCMFSLIVALAYGMYYMDVMDPLAYSLSEIGRHEPTLFILWSVLTGIALFFNVNRLYERLNFRSKPGKILLYIGLFFLVLTFLNMKKDPEYLYWIHVGTAIVFSLTGFASISLPLIYMYKKNLKYRVITSIYFAIVAVDIVLLAIFKQMALFEFIPLTFGYFVMFFTNYTEAFKVDVTK